MCAWSGQTWSGQALAAPVVLSGHAYVIDGDTLVIHRRHVRLFGMDAFERDQRCGQMACGQQATGAMRNLVRGQIVTCVRQDIDPYGRWVSLCHLASGVDPGQEMVRRGLAVAYRTFSDRYVPDEDTARQAKAGAWRYGFESPLAYRRRERR